jgi:hypothetical protein
METVDGNTRITVVRAMGQSEPSTELDTISTYVIWVQSIIHSWVKAPGEKPSRLQLAVLLSDD